VFVGDQVVLWRDGSTRATDLRRRPIEDAEAEQILNAVVDNGIIFMDTASDYGRSEEYMVRFLSHCRDELVLATKCGCTIVRRYESTDDTPHVWTKENLFRGLHESLARMRIDYVDVMQLHKPQRRAPHRPVLDNPETTEWKGTGSRQRLGY
jgi:aryl-alcohol dehydrogenase-like predicted oxidoreductase